MQDSLCHVCSISCATLHQPVSLKPCHVAGIVLCGRILPYHMFSIRHDGNQLQKSSTFNVVYFYGCVAGHWSQAYYSPCMPVGPELTRRLTRRTGCFSMGSEDALSDVQMQAGTRGADAGSREPHAVGPGSHWLLGVPLEAQRGSWHTFSSTGRGRHGKCEYHVSRMET